MKTRVFGILQRIGRSFMLPIAVLPIAGLFLGIGSSLTNETTISSLHLEGVLGNGTFLHDFLIILTKVGSGEKGERSSRFIFNYCFFCYAYNN